MFNNGLEEPLDFNEINKKEDLVGEPLDFNERNKREDLVTYLKYENPNEKKPMILQVKQK